MNHPFDTFIKAYATYLEGHITDHYHAPDLPEGIDMPDESLLSPLQREVWRRVQYCPDDMICGDGCKSCVDQFSEDLELSVRLIHDYLDGKLGHIVTSLVVVYEHTQDGQRSGWSVWVVQDGPDIQVKSEGDLADKVRDYLTNNPSVHVKPLDVSLFPPRIGDYNIVLSSDGAHGAFSCQID